MQTVKSIRRTARAVAPQRISTILRTRHSNLWDTNMAGQMFFCSAFTTVLQQEILKS